MSKLKQTSSDYGSYLKTTWLAFMKKVDDWKNGISCNCPNCNSLLVIHNSQFGQEITCNACNSKVVITVENIIQKICPHCGKMIPYNAKTCSFCYGDISNLRKILDCCSRLLKKSVDFINKLTKKVEKNKHHILCKCQKCNSILRIPISKIGQETICESCHSKIVLTADDIVKKPCPHCGNEIPCNAEVCSFCKKHVDE